MDQYIESNKLKNYLHPKSSSTYKLNTEPVQSSSSSTNSNLIDICVFNSFYKQYIEASSSTTSSHKSLVPSTDLCIQMSPILHVNRSNSNDNQYRRKNSTPILRSRSQKKSSEDQCISNHLPKRISNKQQQQQRHRSSSYQMDNDIASEYQLSNFFIKIEQIPDIWTLNPTNERSIQEDNEDKKSLEVIDKPTRTSRIIRHLLTSSSKSNESDSLFNSQSPQCDNTDSPHKKSPQYRPRHSYVSSSKRKSNSSKNTEFPPKTNLNKSSQMSRKSCHSPLFTRRPQNLLDSIDYDPSLQPIVLLSLSNNHLQNTSSLINTNKRTFESSTTEPIAIKRRYQKSLSTLIIQRKYCISYPINIQRCIDCQIIDPLNLPTHLTGCRFQYCRILKYFDDDDKYNIEGFTTVDKTQSQNIEHLLTPDSSGQPSLNILNANHIFSQIGKLFSLMFSHEETERKIHNEKDIIRKQYMAGWREVCDECSTTLFNYHYMCKICGYMICIECSNEYAQMNIDKRKKLKRICKHENSYCLSEFIPWNILVKLRNECMNYISKFKLDYTIKLYHSKRNEYLSIFIKNLQMKRLHDKHNIQKIWSTIDCNFDPNIEFYCNGRLPVFNEWNSSNAKNFFQQVWSASSPVLVKQVHRNLSKTLWHPNAFKSHMIDHHETPALWDCETLIPIQTNETILTRFWDGFECLNVRLKDGERTRILKLKDWPTKKDFASVFPTRLHDLMTNIPFSDYTRRSYIYNDVIYPGGVFNIVERLPPCLIKPDLGPKLYIAYSQLTSQTSRKAGTTNLHIDVSDAVNVLVYVGIGGQGDDGCDKKDEIRNVEEEILNSNIDQAQLQRLRNGELPGALWHLFRSDDVTKIREYLSRTQRKIPGFDSIHDQTAYLEKDDLENLKTTNNVESYPILQFLGDAVFIPSGSPHQVKNLHSCIKIAEDFVSPENLDRCLITTNEFRTLSKTHTNHADILQAKNILYYATRDILNSLNREHSL